MDWNEETAVLEKVLWTQVARVLYKEPPHWDPASEAGQVIRRILLQPSLLAEESAVLTSCTRVGESSHLSDRLLEARINLALREAMQIEATRAGVEPPPKPPRVVIARQGTQAGKGEKPGRVVDLVTRSADLAALEPGAQLDALIDLLVLANQGAYEELRESLTEDVQASFRVEGEDVTSGLLSGQTTPIKVFQLERSLSRVEEVLREALPADVRPPPSEWSFGKDLSGALLGGKYRIKALKGKGGFGAVYEAVDEMLGARVAVKVLNPKGARSRYALDNFLREAQLLTNLDHENIVRWITFDKTPDGLHYFVMEYLNGEELEEILKREGRLEPKRTARILLQVLAALRRAHHLEGQGALLHLDLKPENVFMLPPAGPGEHERAKVIDFGIGQHVGAEARAAENPEIRSVFDIPPGELHKSAGSVGLPLAEEAKPAHQSGTVRVQRARGGTLLYASPEQCRHLAGHKDIVALDGRSDLYSLGVMAFRLLTGKLPWEQCGTAYQAIQNHLDIPPRKVGSMGVRIPRDLAAFVDRCLIKNRNLRWKDAGEAYQFLERVVNPRVSALKVGVSVGAVAVLAGLALWAAVRGPVDLPVQVADPARGGASPQDIRLGHESLEPYRLRVDGSWDGSEELALLARDKQLPLPGWKVAWEDAGAGTLAISLESAATPESAAAYLQLGSGRRHWVSGSFNLVFLGRMQVDAVSVDGVQAGKLLDPARRTLTVRLGGDGRARENLQTFELRAGERLIGRWDASQVHTSDRSTFTGLPLDGLIGTRGPVELSLLVRDAAGQEAHGSLRLELAGPRVSFDPELTGFHDGPGGKGLTPVQEVYGLLPGSVLRIALTDRSNVTARVLVESNGDEPPLAPVSERIDGPPFTVEIPLARLGLIGGNAVLPGRLLLEADDGEWVERAESRPERRELKVRFYPKLPPVILTLEAGGLTRRMEEGQTTHVKAPGRARVKASWDEGFRLVAETAMAAPGGLSLERLETSPGVGSSSFDYDLARSGSYALTVQTYSSLAAGERGPQIGPDRLYPIVLDADPPIVEVELEGLGEDRIVRAELPRATVRMQEAHPASAEWKLLAADGTPRKIRELSVAEASQTIEREQLWPADVDDGSYVLRVEVRDKAGNRGEGERSVVLARSGPTIDLRSPEHAQRNGRETWLVGRLWDVSARVEDPNGVAEVRAQISEVDGARQRTLHNLRLEPTPGGTYRVPQSDAKRVKPELTGREVEIEIVALDAGGSANRWKFEALVPDVAANYAKRVRGARAPETVMSLLQGNPETHYVFGGRVSQPPGERAWKLAIPPGSLPPFYLDEREVTRGEFLAFVTNPEGYAEESLWPPESGPDPVRREALAGELASAERLAEPVTGVTWAEATGYARWVGKRLPTVLEWEFAVRDGPKYLDSSCGPGKEPWPANLCTGPREWTATPPQLLGESSGLDRATESQTYLPLFLSPFESLVREDLDGDSALDVVSAHFDEDSVRVQWGRLEGSAARPTLELRAQEMGGPRHVLVEDLDGDGLLDLTIACVRSRNLVVFFQRARGELSDGDPLVMALDRKPALALAQDVDGDGRLDLAVHGCKRGPAPLVLRQAEPAVFERAALEATPASMRLPPGARSRDRAWVVGALPDEAPSFRNRRPELITLQAPEAAVGFRCAIDAERAEDSRDFEELLE